MNHPEPHDLTALAYALVSGPERQQLLEHIASCDACREAYDAAFEEQAQVREVMFEEVRSGEAEARALDKVLQALKTGQVVTEEKQGKVLGLFSPWAVGLQIAAALMIAAGVFYVAVVMPRGETQAPGTEVGSNADTTRKDRIEVTGGKLVVAGPTDSEPDRATWTLSTAVPLGVWCRNDSAQPVSFSINGADLSFNNGACFQLQPQDGQVSVYVLRGQANVSNTENTLLVLTNTNEFRANPGTAFEVECQFAFLPSQRGKEVASTDGQTLVRAEVSKGEVIVVPTGDMWESPRSGVVRAGGNFKVQSVESAQSLGDSNSVRKVRAAGPVFDALVLGEAMNRFKQSDPKGYMELRLRIDELETQFKDVNVMLKIVRDGIELTQQHGSVEIKNPKCTVTLTIDDDNYVVAEVTINGETQTYKASSLDELAQKCPAVAELIGAVSIETPTTGKRKISVKRAVYEQQEVQEEKQQKQEQRAK